MDQYVPLHNALQKLSTTPLENKVVGGGTFAVSMGNTTHQAMIPHDAPEIAYVKGPGGARLLRRYFELSYEPK